jgi:ribose-phosphate pyrophosphokinase
MKTFYLHLDKNFKPFNGDEITFERFVFTGGEPHLKINVAFEIDSIVCITTRINTFEEVGFICIAVDALRRMGLKQIDLFIPYFPAARQDRLMVKGEPLSVKVYADIINSLQLNKVIVFDPHSEVTPALLNNVEVMNNYQFIAEVIKRIGSEVKLISPDGGALKKIYKVSEYLGGIDVVECSKNRDVKTGKLSGFKVYDDDLLGMDCLIVDDICDGGSTFIGLAQELKNKNAGKLYLAVSHGIFHKGFEELNKNFTKIFTTNSFKDVESEKLELIKLEI